MQIALLDLDHLIEFHLAFVDSRKELDRDRNFEGAGHRKAFGTVERDAAARFEMDRGYTDDSAGYLSKARDLPFESLKPRLGGRL